MKEENIYLISTVVGLVLYGLVSIGFIKSIRPFTNSELYIVLFSMIMLFQWIHIRHYHKEGLE